MKVDRRWRNKIESLERAGLTYIDKKRLAALPSSETAAQIEESVTVTPSSAEDERLVPPAPVVEISIEERLTGLQVLRDEVAACTRCEQLCQSRTQTVFADGSPTAELCFVGEAPGADEDAQGVPFVGRAGQLLTRIIEACKLKREEVYICNVLKCRPPDNRNPSPVEIENCKPFLARQLELVRPKMLVALGKFAAAHLLGEKPERVPIMKLRGNIRLYNGIPFMITLHPAYLLRNPEAKRDVWEDMKVVMRKIDRPVE